MKTKPENFKSNIKKNKFNARKIEYKGMVFDSKKEFERYLVLQDMEKKGEIEKLKLQYEFILIPDNEVYKGVKYIADFYYWKDFKPVIEDVKGLRKGAAYSLYVIKKKLLYHNFKIIIQEI